MAKKDKYIEKIVALNSAWKAITEGLKLIKRIFPKDNILDNYYWKLEKLNGEMTTYIQKKLEEKYKNEIWKKL